MHDVFLHEFWRGLQFQMPYIIADLVGIVLVLYYRRRFPTPCLFVFMGCVVKLLVALGYPATAAALLPQQDFAAFAKAETVFGIVDASAYGLFFLAAFHGRNAARRPTAWLDYWDDDDDRPLPPGDGTDIKSREVPDDRTEYRG